MWRDHPLFCKIIWKTWCQYYTSDRVICSFYNDLLIGYYGSGIGDTVIKQDRQGPYSHRAHIVAGEKAQKTREQLIKSNDKF